jgi:hypothetical protein
VVGKFRPFCNDIALLKLSEFTLGGSLTIKDNRMCVPIFKNRPPNADLIRAIANKTKELSPLMRTGLSDNSSRPDWGLMVDTFDQKTEGLIWKLRTAVVRAELPKRTTYRKIWNAYVVIFYSVTPGKNTVPIQNVVAVHILCCGWSMFHVY